MSARAGITFEVPEDNLTAAMALCSVMDAKALMEHTHGLTGDEQHYGLTIVRALIEAARDQVGDLERLSSKAVVAGFAAVK